MELNKYIIEDIKDLDLEQTFECGQCFRWNKEPDGSYTGMAGAHPANMKQEDNVLIIEGSGSEEFWRDYLDLGHDYGELKEILCEGECATLPEAVRCGSGIRILNSSFPKTTISPGSRAA